MPGANVAAQHKGCGPISPAFKDIRTLRFLTNSVQIQSLNQLQQVILIRRIAQTNSQPLWFWLTWFGIENSKLAGQWFISLNW